MFEIIKNAEIPQTRRPGSGRKAIYPFAHMEVGDGFDTPRDKGVTIRGDDKRRMVVSNCARQWARKKSSTAKFTVRVLDENTVRCVRIA